VTDATVNNASLAIEAFGTNAVTAVRYLTIRNLAAGTVSGAVTFDPAGWGHPAAEWLRITNLFDGDYLDLASSNSLPVTLTNSECRVYSVQSGPPPKPEILINDGGFGVRSNRFGFNTSAYPGQVVVIEAGTDLVAWTPVQTNLTPDRGWFYYADAVSEGVERRFYRARVE
jgi:hypothetical protein